MGPWPNKKHIQSQETSFYALTRLFRLAEGIPEFLDLTKNMKIPLNNVMWRRQHFSFYLSIFFCNRSYFKSF